MDDPGHLSLSSLEGVIVDLDAVAATWMLVGALARDHLLYRQLGATVPKGLRTQDADAGVSVATREDYTALKAKLEERGWTQEYLEHRMRSREGIVVDLVPFGRLEDPSGSVSFESGDTHLNVTGYAAALAASTREHVDGRTTRVLTLPFYLMLKCLAWEDRRHRTSKDAEDLARVFIAFDERWMTVEDGARISRHADVFDVEDDTLAQSARVLGRECRAAAESDPALSAVMSTWLHTQARDGHKAVGQAMSAASIYQPARRRLAWEAFLRGWKDAQ